MLTVCFALLFLNIKKNLYRTQDKDEVKKKQEEKDGKEDEIESNAFDFSFLQWG